MSTGLAVTGKVWVFGDNLNTDDMYPAFAMRMDPPEAAKHVFYEVRPGWTDEVRPGDIVLAGRNFGVGSSRPVAALFNELGVAGAKRLQTLGMHAVADADPVLIDRRARVVSRAAAPARRMPYTPVARIAAMRRVRWRSSQRTLTSSSTWTRRIRSRRRSCTREQRSPPSSTI